MDESDKYVKAAYAGICELEKLTKKRRELDDKIVKIGKLIIANIGMLPEDQAARLNALFTDTVPTSGLSDAILRVLKGKYLSPIGVREALIEKGHDISEYVNPLASIHTTLKRLHKAGRIGTRTMPDGKVFYGRFEGERPGVTYVSGIEQRKGKKK